MIAPIPSLMPPTPPYSPRTLPSQLPVEQPHLSEQHPLKSTMLLLDDLIASYQYRRMWVCRTRATLEDDLPESPSYSQCAQSLPRQGEDASYAEGSDAYYDRDQCSGSSSPNSRWSKRKRGFKLPRLEGLPSASAKPRRVIHTVPPLEGDGASACQPPPMPVPTREEILSMYEKMVESRMESCQRINKMIHDANRASLHNR